MPYETLCHALSRASKGTALYNRLTELKAVWDGSRRFLELATRAVEQTRYLTDASPSRHYALEQHQRARARIHQHEQTLDDLLNGRAVTIARALETEHFEQTAML